MPKKLSCLGLKVMILVQTPKLFHTYYLRQADRAALTNTILPLKYELQYYNSTAPVGQSI